MPRTNLTVTQLDRRATGVPQPAQQNSDVVNGNALPYNSGDIILEIQNINASSRTVTIGTPGVIDGLAVADLVITVPGTSTVLTGPLPTSVYNQSDGTVALDASGAAGDIKYRVYKL